MMSSTVDVGLAEPLEIDAVLVVMSEDDASKDDAVEAPRYS